jgi:hypothetical protein
MQIMFMIDVKPAQSFQSFYKSGKNDC